MIDSMVVYRRPIRDLSMLGALVLLAGAIMWWAPFGNHDRDPDCQPGMVQIAQSATPTSLNYCFPDTILQRSFPVIPPR